MAVVKCGNKSCGKYYNNGQFDSCQACGASPEMVTPASEEATQLLNQDDTAGVTSATEGLGKYAQTPLSPSPLNIDFDDDTTMALDAEIDLDDEVTVALVKKESGIDPVCGWLVCISGADIGRDYRIKTERNFVGRSANMDIMINGDDSVSRENHASITFDPRALTFTVSAGDGRGLVYLNEKVVETPSQLKAYDILELGESKFLFVPFATKEFSWPSK